MFDSHDRIGTTKTASLLLVLRYDMSCSGDGVRSRTTSFVAEFGEMTNEIRKGTCPMARRFLARWRVLLAALIQTQRHSVSCPGSSFSGRAYMQR